MKWTTSRPSGLCVQDNVGAHGLGVMMGVSGMLSPDNPPPYNPPPATLGDPKKHHLPSVWRSIEDHHVPALRRSREDHHLPAVWRSREDPPPPCCVEVYRGAVIIRHTRASRLEPAEMETLSSSYFEERKAFLLLNKEVDNEDGRNKRQDALWEGTHSGEQQRENGGGKDEDERKERSSHSSEEETDVDEECREIERRKSSRQVCDSDDSTGEPEVRQERKPDWVPNFLCRNGRDVYHYAGHDIIIYESIDSYGSVMWPAALALCSYLESDRLETGLLGKTVLELGAGTGLVAIVSSLLGAAVTATDLPDVLGNLTANVMRNTRGSCRHTPQFTALSWGHDLERSFPRSLHHYDYVLAADVVYHHDFLPELLLTMQHFCQPGTTLLWANKVRFSTDLSFTHRFQQSFHTQLLLEEGDMKIYKATSREEGDIET